MLADGRDLGEVRLVHPVADTHTHTHTHTHTRTPDEREKRDSIQKLFRK